MFEFNFKITYKSNVQDTKSNNFTRRFANLLELDDNDDERKKYNYVTLLKKEHLNKKIRNVVNLVVALLNEIQKTIDHLVAMIYDLNEKSSFEKKMTKNVDTYKQSISKFKVKNMIMFDARYQNIKRNNKSLDYKNLKSYLIVRAINNCVYEFKLLEVMKNIFLVFHS